MRKLSRAALVVVAVAAGAAFGSDIPDGSWGDNPFDRNTQRLEWEEFHETHNPYKADSTDAELWRLNFRVRMDRQQEIFEQFYKPRLESIEAQLQEMKGLHQLCANLLYMNASALAVLVAIALFRIYLQSATRRWF